MILGEESRSRSAARNRTRDCGSTLARWPWEHSLIHEHAKRPLDLPLTFLVVVSPDDASSQQKPKLILTVGSEDDDSRPEPCWQ